MRMLGDLGFLSSSQLRVLLAFAILKKKALFPNILAAVGPGVFSDAEIIATNAALALPKSPTQAQVNTGIQAINAVTKKLLAHTAAASLDRNEYIRRRNLYYAWNPPDDHSVLKKFLIGAAILVTAGAATGAFAAGGAGASGAAAGAGTGIGAGGGFVSATGLAAPGLTTGLVATGGSVTAASAALASLKKLAIDYGLEYAMGKAAEEYAKREQKKMSAEMTTNLEKELAAAQAEYQQLTAAGATPETAARQATSTSVKLAPVLIGAAILALLLLRR